MSTTLRRHSADLCMGLAVTIWGLHFIVVKDALDTLPPVTFNALRLGIALIALLVVRWRRQISLRVARADVPRLLLLGLLGQLAHQLFFVLGLDYTTSTNTSLLIGSAPTWIAVLSVLLGITMLNRAVVAGVGLTLAGVALITLGQPGAELSLTSSDMLGCAFGLGSALAVASYNIAVKPLMDRYGGLPVVIWVFAATWIGLLIAAAPDLATRPLTGLSPRIWLSLFYSGACSAALGYMLETHALRTLGSARAGTYYNAMPVIAACAGVLLLDEPVTGMIVVGGALTITGVILVRARTLLRDPGAEHAPELAPAAAHDAA